MEMAQKWYSEAAGVSAKLMVRFKNGKTGCFGHRSADMDRHATEFVSPIPQADDLIPLPLSGFTPTVDKHVEEAQNQYG